MSSILTDVSGGVMTIKLNRPDKLNSFNREMALAFQKALDEANESDKIRAVYLTGEGRAFSAGQDLQEAISSEGPELKRIVKEHYNPVILKLRNLHKPVVCGVNGVAAGAGANIVFACDIVFAAKSANFIQAFSKIGLIPDSGGTFSLPRLIGFQKASALMMLGDKVPAEEAEKLGMVYKVVEDDQLEGEASGCAAKLAKMPTLGLWLTKKALNESMNNSLEDQLNLEEILQTEAGASYDYSEGVNAFLEKRKPVFRGK